MRIGLMHGDDGQRTIDQHIADAVQEEKDGFEVSWWGQIFGADSMTLIAAAGLQTSRMEFATAVVPTYPRHPFAMAQQALTVRQATGGRFTLGIGPSHHLVVENMWGISYDKPAKHMREYLKVLLPLAEKGNVNFSGDLYKVQAGMAVKDATPMPVMISALAPTMLKIAGSMTAGTITWMAGMKTVETHIVPSITKAASEAGRPAPRVAVGLPICVTDDIDAAKQAAAQGFVVYGTLPNYRRMLDKEGAAGPADVAIVGNEAEVEKQLRNLASTGATDLIAPIFPAGANAGESLARTRALLKSLIGKI
jgi:F420-dependent oxidoreductase-like protein